jgi:acetoin utilization deacetylase AcuC-like enzyme
MTTGRGGPGRGQGRKPGVPNKRTQETMGMARRLGVADPLESTLLLHDWAVKEKAAAEKALRAHDKDMGKRLREGVPMSAEETKIWNSIRADLKAEVTRCAATAVDFAAKALPFIHSRLSAVDAQVNHTAHEDALDDLDDENEGDIDGDSDDDAPAGAADFDD